jgi:hypothetical protein
MTQTRWTRVECISSGRLGRVACPPYVVTGDRMVQVRWDDGTLTVRRASSLIII